MMYAIDNETGKKILAEKGKEAKCPQCRGTMIARCGDLNMHHWAHETLNDCDTWSEGETEWHMKWKSYCKPEYVEVVVGEHRADIKNKAGTVIELQSGGISMENKHIRERYYGNMIWIFKNKSEFVELSRENNVKVPDNRDFMSMENQTIYTYWWKYSSRCITDPDEYLNKNFDEDLSDMEQMNVAIKYKTFHIYLDREDEREMWWICDGRLEKGKIIVKVVKIDKKVFKDLYFNDIQQFSQARLFERF